MKGCHIFDDPVFWQHFKTEVRSKAWHCIFPSSILLDTMDKDASLYKDDEIFKKRRRGAVRWVTDTKEWVTVTLGACKEVAHKELGIHTQKLKYLHMLEAFTDFVDHLNYFHMVSISMASREHPVRPLSQDSSSIHDIDKLDPIMMVAYAERFEDNVSTSLWDICVERHTRVNPHHQAHCLWHDCCKDAGHCNFCEDVRLRALREMVCDKVSRRVQKSLGGHMSKDMWDVELDFYSGLPKEWLDKASEMMHDLKEYNSSSF